VNRYRAKPRVDDDLIEAARWIRADHPRAARRFLDVAFGTFERVAAFPESGPPARLKAKRLAGVRYCVMPPPFNRWLVFYQPDETGIEIVRVLYGTQNWRANPDAFFV
jgi:plasmid stabilization system protein ParE